MHKNTEGVLIEYPVKRKHKISKRRSKVGFL